MEHQISQKSWFGRILSERSVRITLVAWILAIVVAYLLGAHGLPFDRPRLDEAPVLVQIVMIPLLIVPIYFLTFMGLTYLLTRNRDKVDLLRRTPEESIARKEVISVLIYGFIMLILGQIIGKIIFGEGIGAHLHGSIFGATRNVTPAEVYAWSVYNFIAFAIIPYVIFRRKGYDNDRLSLKSSNVKNDTVLVLVLLAVGAALDLVDSEIFSLTGSQVMVGFSLTFVTHLFGTALPVMIFIFCILLPRYFRLSGSIITTTILGGLTYAGLHIFEYWTVYDTLTNSVLSVCFVFLQFLVPGMIKSFLTLRTGNAWVHVWAYHAISPHVTADTPNVVRYFNLK